MKNLMVISLLVILSSCGKSKSGSSVVAAKPCKDFPYNGQWDDRNFSSTLTVGDSCTIEDLRCQTKGTYTVANDFATSGNFDLVVTVNNFGMNCLPTGNYTCNSLGSNASYLRITCQGIVGVLEFDKI